MVAAGPPAPTTTPLSPEQQMQLLQKALDGPAMAPPPGVKPNFVNPPNLEKEFYVDLILCLTISVLAVCMRMWTKARLVRKVHTEDCKKLLPPASFFFFGSSFPSLSHTHTHCPFSPLPHLLHYRYYIVVMLKKIEKRMERLIK